MGFFGPSREERLAGAARALAPYGFRPDPRRASELRKYEPFTLLWQPESYVAGFFGSIEGAPVEAYEYGYTTTSEEGGTIHNSVLVVAIHHPWVNGGAAFQPDPREWDGVSAVIDALLWIPPFTIVKALQLVMEARHPDRNVGHPQFDRLYQVRAESNAAARRAITPDLRAVCLRLAFRGTVELRPGTLLYSPHGYELDERTAVHALGIGAAFLGALSPKVAHPMR